MKRICITFIIILFIFGLTSCKNENELETRVESYLNEVFNDQKILDIFNASEQEISEFVFHLAVYKGIVHKRPMQIGEGLTLQQIEENIHEITGDNTLMMKINYNYIPADYDEKNKIFVPFIYGAPSYGFRYVIHDIKHSSDYFYEVVVSYIDTNAFISSFDPDGNRINYDYTETFDSSGADNRNKAINDLKADILKNPEKYERVNILLAITDEHIYFRGVCEINK